MNSCARTRRRPAAGHDFGKDIIPGMIADGHRVFAYRFRDENKKARPYWRDVGTLDAYYQANMDLDRRADPFLNLYDGDRGWCGRPAAAVAAAEVRPPGEGGPAGHVPPRRGDWTASSATGCDGVRRRGPAEHPQRQRCRVNSYAVVEDSILFDGVDVGRYCRVRRAILDKDVKLPPYTVLGLRPGLRPAPAASP